MVHVAQEAGDGDLADGLAEEELLDGGLADGAQAGHEEQQAAEACGLARVACAHVVAEDALRLVLQHLHGLRVAQLARFCNHRRNAAPVHILFNSKNKPSRN